MKKNTSNEQWNELAALVARAEKHRVVLRLNDTQFVARFKRHVSSYDTWTRTLRPMDPERLRSRLGKWLGNMRAFAAEIDGGTPVAVFHAAMPMAVYAETMYQRLNGSANDRRCAVLVGTTGVGKTATLRWLAREHADEGCSYVRADQTWTGSRMQIVTGLCRAVGVEPDPQRAGASWRALVGQLKADPVTLLIDEAHEGGVLLWKLLKSVIDETGARVMLGTYPTAWKRMVYASTDSHAEAQQLLGRTMKPIARHWVQGPRVKDVEVFVRSECPELNGAAGDVAGSLRPLARKLGLRLVDDAIQAARDEAEDTGGELSARLILEAARDLGDCRLSEREEE